MGESLMNKFYRAIAWIFCISFFTFQHSFASEYIPWQKNDFLLYKSDANRQQTLSIDQTSSVWRHVTNFSAFGPTWIYSGSLSEEVKLYSPDTISFQTFIDFNLTVGSSRSINILPCNTGTVTIAEKNTQLSVPAGVFSDVIQINLESNCSDAGVTSIWFAKHIGIIQWTELNIAGIERFQLQQATISGEVFPANQGLIVKAVFPDSKIWINQMPPLPNDTPTVLLSMQIENYMDHEVKYEFNTSQRYDIIIRNEIGETVSQWSRDMNFLTVVGDIIIPPKGKYNIANTIDLTNELNEVLPPGNYQFEILMTSPTGPKVSQIIEIDHAF